MKILHCLNHFLPSQTAGTEVYTWALCKGLQQQNIIAEVVMPNYGKKEATGYEHDGIRVHQFAEPSVIDRDLQMGFSIPEGVAHFTRLVKELKPDIIHFHELAGSNGFTLHHVKAIRSMGFKIVMTFHIVDYSCKAKTLMYKDATLCDGIIDEYRCSECMLSKQLTPSQIKPVLTIAKMLYKLNADVSHFHSKAATALSYPFLIHKLKKDLFSLQSNCDQLVVLTKWYQKILINNGLKEEKITLITQGLVNQSSQIETSELTGIEKLKLIFVGRISPFKGLHLILEAIERFDDNDICLDVYGAGEDEYAKEHISKMQKSQNVDFKGKLEPSLVVNTMHHYDAFVLASTVCEMSPLVIQEAYAAGIPVIASDVYGNAEQIRDGVDGWLFKFNDRNDLYKILKSKSRRYLTAMEKMVYDFRIFHNN